MEFFNNPVNKDEQLQKIIDDTHEIIRNFREISEIMVDKVQSSHGLMYNLGKKVVNRQNNDTDSGSNLGRNQVNLI